jgi:hypothetical protein
VFDRGACVGEEERGEDTDAQDASDEDEAEGGDPMSWRDATAASIVLTAAHVFIAFLTLYDLTKILGDPASFAFDLFKFAGASFFGTFIALTGLSRYQNR